MLRWSQLQPEKLQEIKIDLSIPCCYRRISISTLDLWLWCPWFQNHSKGNEYLPHTQLYPSLRNCPWPSGLVSVRKHLTASCSFIWNAQISSLHYFCTRSIESLIMCALTSARVCSGNKHVLSTSSSLNVGGAHRNTHCRKKSARCLHGSQKTDKRGTALSGEDRNHCSRGKLLTGLW